MSPVRSLLVLACLAAFTTQAQTPIPPPPSGAYRVEVSKFIEADALQEASGLTWAPDGSNRLFVVLKGGKVRVIQNGALLPGGCGAGATALPGVLARWLLAGLVWKPRRARRS